MSGKDCGGSAFPTLSNIAHNSDWTDEEGMTLRDYFAAKAMHAACITDTVPGEACDALMEAAAKAKQDPAYRLCLNAYEMTDNMLKARNA